MNIDDFIIGAVGGACVLLFALIVFAIVSAGPIVAAIILSMLGFIVLCGLFYAIIKR